uniref:Uncharacterized protein n=1 Tax=Arundo donax TaxID=35708 RepID=A0A0A9CAM9_ARUDO
MSCRACGCGAAGPDGEAPREELDAPLLDLEQGPGQGHTTAPLPADAMMEITAKAGLTDAKKQLERAATKIIKCIIRGLLALLWVFFVDFLRRLLNTDNEALIVILGGPFALPILVVLMLFFTLMESLDECFPTL